MSFNKKGLIIYLQINKENNRGYEEFMRSDENLYSFAEIETSFFICVQISMKQLELAEYLR